MRDIFFASPTWTWWDNGAVLLMGLVVLTGWVVVGGMCIRFMSWFIFRYLLKKLYEDYQFFRTA